MQCSQDSGSKVKGRWVRVQGGSKHTINGKGSKDSWPVYS